MVVFQCENSPQKKKSLEFGLARSGLCIISSSEEWLNPVLSDALINALSGRTVAQRHFSSDLHLSLK